MKTTKSVKINIMNLISHKSFLIHICNLFIYIFVIFSLILVILIFIPLPVQVPLDYTLIWSDEFNGNTLSSDWRVYVDNQGGATSDTLFHPSLVTVSNGQLHLGIAMNPGAGRKYIGGGVDDLNSVASGLTQGRWEVRARMPVGYGTDGYIGLYAFNGEWPPEIIIAETIGKRSNTSYLIQINGTNASPIYDTTGIVQSNPGFTQGFNVYAFEWEGDQLRWYINDELKKISKQHYNTVEMKFGMGAWSGICGPDWPDCAKISDLPAYLDIDYVRIYKKN